MKNPAFWTGFRTSLLIFPAEGQKLVAKYAFFNL